MDCLLEGGEQHIFFHRKMLLQRSAKFVKESVRTIPEFGSDRFFSFDAKLVAASVVRA
jgi:hypothetical protein